MKFTMLHEIAFRSNPYSNREISKMWSLIDFIETIYKRINTKNIEDINSVFKKFDEYFNL